MTVKGLIKEELWAGRWGGLSSNIFQKTKNVRSGRGEYLQYQEHKVIVK